MSEVNCVLDRSDFEEQMVRIIPKAENTFEYKYDQQYVQSDQSNITNNTIKTTLEMVSVTSVI